MANQLDVADAQLLGFFHGKWHRDDVIGLINAMNLTKKEWLKLKSDYPTLTSMDDDDIKEIDEHFGIKE